MTESLFLNFFQRLASKAYSRSDLKENLIKVNSYLASNLIDNDSKEKLYTSSILLAETNIELYIRIMNSCMENSLYCFNCILVRSSIYLINRKFAGDISSLDINYQKMFLNVISIILNNEMLDQIDIIDSCDSDIILGKDPRVRVSYQKLIQFENKIFEVLNKKYTKKLVESEYDLESTELSNYIRKLNTVYTNFGKCISFSSENYCYSENNSERHLQKRLSSSDYDDKMYYDRSVLLFPLILDIEVVNEKIIISNEGFGNLNNCIFTITYPKNDEKIFKMNVDIPCRKDYVVYIDPPVKTRLLQLFGNEQLKFKFDFIKFDHRYLFSIEKKIGPINEELRKQEKYIVNDFRNNHGNIANNSNNVNQSIGKNVHIEKNNIQQLRESYNELAKLVEESDLEASTKEELETSIKEGIEETNKEYLSISVIEKGIDKMVRLVGVANKLFPVIMKIKDLADNYIPK